MLKNYLKVAVRILLKHKAYSFINVLGLAVGLVCCLLIGLYVEEELNYDRHHEKAGRLYRVMMESRTPEKESYFALSPAPLGEVLVRDFPEVESSTRLFSLFGKATVSYEEKYLMENRIFFADSTFFDLFSVPLLAGDPQSALSKPNSIVLSETMARKYFGSENPLGKVMRVNSDFDVRVTALMADIPAGTHFHPDFLVSLSSFGFSRSPSFISNNNFHTYIVLRDGTNPKELEAKFPAAVRRYSASQVSERFGQSFEARAAAGFSTSWSLIPVPDIHLYSHRQYEIEANGDIATVYILSAVALFVLLIACVNFVNLATTRAANRAREIGVRKIVGSNRLQLLLQFFTESMVLSVLSAVIAAVLVELIIPAFNTLSGKQIESVFFRDGFWLLGIVGIALSVGFLAGIYPAIVLSSLRPVDMLKGGNSTGGRASVVRSGLVIFQFAVSVALIIGTLVVQRQLEFLSNQKLGFDKEQVLVISRAQSLDRRLEVFKQELAGDPGILNVAASTTLPGRLFGRSTYRDIHVSSGESSTLHEMEADHDFVPTLGLKLAAGRNFSRNIASDSSAVILNQAAAKLFGWADPVGQQLTYPGPQQNWRGTVVGVVEDFHFESLHSPIQPLLILHQPSYQYISVRLRPEDIAVTIRSIESVWKKLAPQQPFEFSFLDQDFNALYSAEQKTGTIFEIFSALAVAIACLGQLGLAAYMIEKRTKEIGVRKVLGASVSSVVALLSKEFVVLVTLANVIAWPVGAYAMNLWLENFAYRTDIGLWTFVQAGVLALFIALLTVSVQAIRAALANPVGSLRYE